MVQVHSGAPKRNHPFTGWFLFAPVERTIQVHKFTLQRKSDEVRRYKNKGKDKEAATQSLKEGGVSEWSIRVRQTEDKGAYSALSS